MTYPANSMVPQDETGVYPALGGLVPASLGRRAVGRLAEAVIGGALSAVVFLIFARQGSAAGLLIWVVAMWIYAMGTYLYFGMTGYLPGGKLVGIRQVRVQTASAPGWAGVLKYLLSALINGLTFGIGYLVIIALIPRNPLNRGWHDRVAGLIVIDTKASHSRPVVGLAANQPTGRVFEPPAGVASLPPVPGISPIRYTGPALDPVQPPAAPFVSSQPTLGASEPISAVPWTTPSPVQETLQRPGITAVESEMQLTQQVAIPLQVPKPSAGNSRYLVTRDDGTQFDPHSVALIGRNPGPNPKFPGAQLISLNDDTRTVSKTHLAVGVGQDGPWVQDLHSTNGSALASEISTEPLVPEVRTSIAAGARVSFGDRYLKVELA